MTARIFQPSKSATQSGDARSKLWLLEYEPASPREIDPLMGWTGSSDMKSQLRLNFGSKDEAVAYAQKHGLAYRVEEPKTHVRRIQSYADNFRATRLGQWTH